MSGIVVARWAGGWGSGGEDAEDLSGGAALLDGVGRGASDVAEDFEGLGFQAFGEFGGDEVAGRGDVGLSKPGEAVSQRGVLVLGEREDIAGEGEEVVEECGIPGC